MFLPLLAAVVLALASSSAAMAKVTHAKNPSNGFQTTGASGVPSPASNKPVTEATYHHNKVR
jgi:opacity protein-like surface antigen